MIYASMKLAIPLSRYLISKMVFPRIDFFLQILAFSVENNRTDNAINKLSIVK